MRKHGKKVLLVIRGTVCNNSDMKIRGFNGQALLRNIPPIGMRIVKTSVAVSVALMVKYLTGFTGADMTTEAAVTAIICMTPHVRDSRTYAASRFTATLIGAVCGILYLFVLMSATKNMAGTNLPEMVISYLLMGVGAGITIYACVLLKKADAATLAAIVFLCIVSAFPEIEDPVVYTCQRLLDVVIGTVIAVIINNFKLPKIKNPNLVFFVKIKDLAPDRTVPISSAEYFQLERLSSEGARICLISEHAPAFFLQQIGHIRLNTPLIVMNGAAVFDPDEGEYLWKSCLSEDVSSSLISAFEKTGIGYSVYSIHNNRTCIFHRGPVSDAESRIFGRMKSTPYRSYFDEDNFNLSEIVYFKITDTDENMEEIKTRLSDYLPSSGIRLFERADSNEKGVGSVYFYSDKALMETAREKVMEISSRTSPGAELQSLEVFLPEQYRYERDGNHVLNIVSRNFEHVSLKALFRKPGKKASG